MAAHPQYTTRGSALPAHADNVGPTERWISTVAGLGLALSTARGGSAIGRLLRGAAAATLLGRGATGFCAMRGALRGQTTFREGLTEQWHRISAGVTATQASRIDSMESMYISELQELHSAEQQLCELTGNLAMKLGDSPLSARIDAYAAELRARKTDLEGLLARNGISPRAHPDSAMQALAHETTKMAQVSAPKVRDAAIAASLQRIIHYRIAGYGCIAAYAKALGRVDEAAHFAGLADRDKAVDGELTELAKNTLNPQATVTPQEQAPAGVRAH